MGRAKEELYDIQLADRDRYFSKLLGISLEELELLDWDISEETNDDGFLYGYIMQFSEESDPDVLDKIQDQLDGHDFLYLDISDVEIPFIEGDDVQSNQYKVFENHIRSVNDILALPCSPDAKFSLYVMLFAHIISATEGYLSSQFIYQVSRNPKLMRKLVENDKELSKRTFSLKEIYHQKENLNDTVSKHLKDLIFHNVAKAKEMYSAILNYQMEELGWLFKAVEVRHHCVHRAGYDKDGSPVSITKDALIELVNRCDELCLSIDKHLNN
ncbi:hypothetical protein K5B43_004647 [Vibrio parahaemolyticus]|uniref:hypothetical protein n=1 Tax=Vibrio parahaemolyticus TaxID=670 RepID=UPI00041B9012|nr:hypothetical protein [Vibrio parahaemolyticus]EGR3304377.1 hypothetical protein [Vibrio parahaemolyticus]EGR3320805.1 hypothetical protein [Vibrio parahaemolyticus]EHY9861305.1 hypothetical protein [Vibrio parahaemolyticus]EJB8445168.1 hypothetical protein [Vibrio parahaemolyticus]EKL9960280.1 hypothetical protein [Vibrio parahaemolyticus]